MTHTFQQQSDTHLPILPPISFPFETGSLKDHPFVPLPRNTKKTRTNEKTTAVLYVKKNKNLKGELNWKSIGSLFITFRDF